MLRPTEAKAKLDIIDLIFERAEAWIAGAQQLQWRFTEFLST